MVNYWDKYTEMHGQKNDKYTEMHGQQNDKYTEMHGQQSDKYTEMHGQQNDKYTEMHGQQNFKIYITLVMHNYGSPRVWYKCIETCRSDYNTNIVKIKIYIVQCWLK